MKLIEKHGFYLLLIASLAIFTANSWGFSIYILDEAKNASCAREMLEQNDLIVPTFNYELRTDKPPLHYYFMHLGYLLFGINEFGARFFSSLMGVLTVLATYSFTKRYLGNISAFFAGFTLLTSIQFALQFHLATPDPYLIFFTALGIFSFFHAHQQKHRSYLLIFYISIALAVLAKGPVAIALPGLILLIYLISQKDFKASTVLWALHLPSLLLFLLLVLPWYIAVHIQTNGAFTEGFFLKHNLSRFSSTMEGHGGGIYMIPLFIITGLFPFSIFILQAIRNGWKHRQQSPFLTLSLIVTGVFLVFFSISRTKLPSYPAPCFPFVAILIGHFIAEAIALGNKPFKLKPSLIVYLVLTLLMPLAVYFGVQFDEGIQSLQYLAFFFLLLPIGALVALMNASKPFKSFMALGLTAGASSLLIFYFVLPAVDKQNPVHQSIEVLQKAKRVVSYQRFNPAFAFYLKKPVQQLPTVHEVDQYLKKHADAVIITNSRNKDGLDSLQLQYPLVVDLKDLFEIRTTKVFQANNSKTEISFTPKSK